MAAPIVLRADFTADDLRSLARRSRDAGQARRLLALATTYDGGSRGDAARAGGVTLQIVRDWVLRFNPNFSLVGDVTACGDSVIGAAGGVVLATWRGGG